MKLDLDRYNTSIKEDATEMIADMKAEGSSMGIVHRKDSPSRTASLPRLKAGFKEEEGMISVISVKFPRQLIWTHRGAGKGRGGRKGSKWVDKYGVTKTTNPKSFGKMGTGGRREKPFINNILDSDRGVEKLATTAAEHLGDAIINKMLIR